MKLSLIQMQVMKEPEPNLEKAVQMIKRAKNEGADMAVLPEMCCCPYNNKSFVKFAMKEDSPFVNGLAKAAKDNGIWLVAGTVPEKDGDRIYNTSFVFNREGKSVAKHRKVHLFDINVKNGQKFKESDTFTPGDEATSFDTEFGKIGLIVCFDVRFPEISRKLIDTELIIVPAAFNSTTGVHWETLFRARALDNQLYMAGSAPATNWDMEYKAWGHSIVTDPWGRVLGQLGRDEGILTVDLDFEYTSEVRAQLPVLKNRRTDIY